MHIVVSRLEHPNTPILVAFLTFTTEKTATNNVSVDGSTICKSPTWNWLGLNRDVNRSSSFVVYSTSNFIGEKSAFILAKLHRRHCERGSSCGEKHVLTAEALISCIQV